VQPGRQDAGGVDDKHVAGLHQLGEVPDEAVHDRSGRTGRVEEASGVARFCWLLGDRRLWKVVLRYVHRGRG
jgi:hypothetical protein